MPDRRESNDAAITAQLGALIEGIESADLDALMRLYSADVVSFDVEPPLQHVGTAAKSKNWAKVFTFFEKPTYELRDLTLTVGQDVAFAHAFGRLGGTLRGGPTVTGMWVRATFGFRKLDGVWLITHDQVSVPFDMSTGQGVTDLEP
ncbi:YybH family protein [Nocardia jejuensis]|uniref:YybH family protein n=1 Tax=Nocardia jejuensis TaxID=328049 RepID=UPI00082E46E3|nr:nuclear transport factor 2 family protein [Nocardia jejuensis]